MSGDEGQKSASAQRRAALKSRRESQEASGSAPPRPASKKGKSKYYEHVFTDSSGRNWTPEEVAEYDRRTGEGEKLTYDQVRADMQQARVTSQVTPSPPASLDAHKAPTPKNARSRTASSSLSPPPAGSPVQSKKITLKFSMSNTGNAKGKERQSDADPAEEEPSSKKRQASPPKKKTIKSAGSSPVKKPAAPRKGLKKTGRVLSDSESDEDSVPTPPPCQKARAKAKPETALEDDVEGGAKAGPSKAVKSLKVKSVSGPATPKLSGISTPLDSQPVSGNASPRVDSPAAKAGAVEGVARKITAKNKRVTQVEGDEADDDAPSPKRPKAAEKGQDGDLPKEKAKSKGKKEQGDELPAPSKVKRETADASGTPKLPRQQISGTFKKTATPVGGVKKAPAKTASDSGGLIGGIYKNLLGKTADGQKPQIAANGRIIPPPKKMLYRDTKLTDQEEQQYISRKDTREEDVRKRTMSLSETFDLEESGNMIREFEKAPRCLPGLMPSVRFGEGGELVEALIRARRARVAGM